MQQQQARQLLSGSLLSNYMFSWIGIEYMRPCCSTHCVSIERVLSGILRLAQHYCTVWDRISCNNSCQICCRVKDKVRRLARHHKVFLTDVQKLHDNLDRTKKEAKSALEAKKRMLIQAIERRHDEALEAVDDEVQAKKLPLEQAAGDIKRSSAVLEAALETLEDKLKEPQQDFIQRFVPMIEVRHVPSGCSTEVQVLRCVHRSSVEQVQCLHKMASNGSVHTLTQSCVICRILSRTWAMRYRYGRSMILLWKMTWCFPNLHSFFCTQVCDSTHT